MKATICKHLYILLSFFILSSNCFAAEQPNVPPKTVPPVTGTIGPPGTNKGCPINLTTGSVWDRMTDIAIPCPGFDLVLKRTYSSKLNLEGMPFGSGWTHSLDPRLLFGNNGIVCFSPGDADFIELRESVAVTSSDDRPGIYIARPPKLDKDLKLTSLSDGWRLTAPGYVNMDFSKTGLIRREWNEAGQSLDFIRDGSNRLVRVEHSCGQSIVFEYNGTNSLISRVSVPGQNLSVEYVHDTVKTFVGVVSNAWNLVQTRRITSSGTETEKFTYEVGGHYMTVSEGRSGMTFHYSYTNVSSAIPSEPPHRNAASTYGEPGRLYEYKAEYVDAETSIAREIRDGETLETTFVKNMVSGQPLENRHPCSETVFYSYADGTRLLDTTVRRGKPVYEGFDINVDPVSDKYAEKIERDSDHRVISVKRGFFKTLGNDISPLDAAPAWQQSYAFNSRLPGTTTDPCGRVSGASYSFEGLLLSKWTHLNSSSSISETFVYTDGLLSEHRDPEKRLTSFGYGPGGYVTSVTPSAGPSLKMGWNASLGILTNLVLQGPEGISRVIVKEVNELGRVNKIVRPDGLAETFLRDAAGRVTNHVDVAGRVTRTTYHPGGKPSEIIQDAKGLAASIRFDYSQQMDSLRIRDPLNREVERYVLDGLGRAEKIYDIEGREMTVRYRLKDIVSSVTRFDGTRIYMSYDIGARLTYVTYPDGTTSYGWLPCGRPSGATNALATAEYSYDGAGRLVSESVRSRTSAFSDMTISYGLDRSGLVTNTVLSLTGNRALLSEKATYDQAARLAVQTTEAGVFTNTYCSWSGGLEAVSNSYLTASYSSDILDRVTNITYRTASGELVRALFYAYDLPGMITQKVDMAGSLCITNVYTYDGLNRLLSEAAIQSGSNVTRQYTYDLAGNRLSASFNGLTNTYTYGIGNRLSNVSDGTGYAHDNAGNVSRIVRNGSTLDLVWNLQGQLLAVTNNGVLAESYTYDPLGRRLSTTTGGSTVYHAYKGAQCIADFDATGNLIRSYIWGLGIDNLLAMTVYNPSATNTFYAVKDHLGSVQALVDSTGNVVESYRYDAYGNTTILSSDLSPLISSAYGNRYLFQGREYSSASGLYSFRARWYDSQAGRWLSNDPIGISGGLNLYAFCGNNPVMFVDPKGKSVIFTAVVTIGLGLPATLIATRVLVNYGNAAAITVMPLGIPLTIEKGANFEKLSLPEQEIIYNHELMHFQFGASELEAYEMQKMNACRLLTEGYGGFLGEGGRELTIAERDGVKSLLNDAEETIKYLKDPSIPSWKKTGLYMVMAANLGWL